MNNKGYAGRQEGKNLGRKEGRKGEPAFRSDGSGPTSILPTRYTCWRNTGRWWEGGRYVPSPPLSLLSLSPSLLSLSILVSHSGFLCSLLQSILHLPSVFRPVSYPSLLPCANGLKVYARISTPLYTSPGSSTAYNKAGVKIHSSGWVSGRAGLLLPGKEHDPKCLSIM